MTSKVRAIGTSVQALDISGNDVAEDAALAILLDHRNAAINSHSVRALRQLPVQAFLGEAGPLIGSHIGEPYAAEVHTLRPSALCKMNCSLATYIGNVSGARMKLAGK